MEMDLGSVILGAVLIILCTLPFIIMSRNKKKSEKKVLQSLSSIATKNNCKIDQHDIIGNFAIGIDQTKNIVFFFRQAKDKEIEQFVDLHEVKSCKVTKTSRTLTNGGRNQVVIDKLELSFIPTTNNKPEVLLEFFNIDNNTPLSEEFQSIEKWSKLINDRLNQGK